jgi:hypothetical protein
MIFAAKGKKKNPKNGKPAKQDCRVDLTRWAMVMAGGRSCSTTASDARLK